MDLALRGRIVLITGGSQGMGAALAAAFAEEGCDLRLVARSAENLNRVASKAVSRSGVDARTLALDISASDSIDRILNFAGNVDILINNAGDIPGGDLWQVDDAKWRASWDLKVFGYINLIRAFYPRMKARRSGVILNNIGHAGEIFDFNYIAGTTGCAALMAFTRAIGGRSMEDGVRVLGVNPGPVDTDRIYRILQAGAVARFGKELSREELVKGYPGGRVATVREVADLFLFLASDRSSYTSGAIVTVDGGNTSRRSIG